MARHPVGRSLWSALIGDRLFHLVCCNTGTDSDTGAVVQLVVPVLAAFGGVFFVSEKISLRLVASTIMILGGVALVLLGRRLLVESGVVRQG